MTTGDTGGTAGDPLGAVLRQLVEASPLGVAIADDQGLLLHANDAYCALVGRPLAALVGRSSREWTHPDRLAAHASMARLEVEAEARGERPWVETCYVRPDGSARWAWVTTARLTGPGGVRWTAGYVQDITVRRDAEEALRRGATTDPLTGLLNRRGWRERTDALLGAATGPLTVAVLDLDHFKDFNDRHGHTAGDELLRAFGTALASVVDEAVPVARWGGEEFAVALPDAPSGRAADLLQAIAALLPAGQTLSGGHTRRRPGEPLEQTLARADQLLYRAKAAGRDRLATDG
ncbi:hypothetical protein GCM10027047_04520 [Rhodococcus aerolatus]